MALVPSKLRDQRHLLVFKRTKNSPLLDENGNKSNWNVYVKQYLDIAEGSVPSSIWDYPNTQGTSSLKKLGVNFDYSKPVDLLRRVVEVTGNENAIVLDFFAGSGTTAHAVAELNKEDGGRRQCILVTDGGKTEEMGESSKNAKEDAVNIAEEITYERVRRVLTGKDWADGKEHDPLGGNLRYFNVELHDIQGATKMDKEQLVEYVTTDHASILGNAFTTVEEMNVFDDELWLHKTYKVFSAPTSAEGVLRYVVGVSRHDFELAELRDYLTSLPTDTEVILVGNNLDRIAWVKENLEKYKVVNLMDSVIESHHWVKTVLLHDH